MKPSTGIPAAQSRELEPTPLTAALVAAAQEFNVARQAMRGELEQTRRPCPSCGCVHPEKRDTDMPSWGRYSDASVKLSRAVEAMGT
jgi:hypothetical protein